MSLRIIVADEERDRFSQRFEDGRRFESFEDGRRFESFEDGRRGVPRGFLCKYFLCSQIGNLVQFLINATWKMT
jgi:hypothetical protein